jgi:hypothetical protein
MKKALLVSVTLLTILSSYSENKPANQQLATNDPDSLTGKSTYVNPVDNKTYTTEGEFKEYQPERGVIPVDGPVQPQIILLTDQEAIAGMIDIEKLANFIKGANEIVIKQLHTVKEKGQLIVQYTLHADKKAKFVISYNGDFKRKDLTEVSNKIEQYSNTITTQKDSCVFQCVYRINEKH